MVDAGKLNSDPENTRREAARLQLGHDVPTEESQLADSRGRPGDRQQSQQALRALRRAALWEITARS